MWTETELRDRFLKECQRRGLYMTIFTTNGFQLKGRIAGFDEDVLIVTQNDGKQSMVFRHAVSTVVPNVKLEETPL